MAVDATMRWANGRKYRIQKRAVVEMNSGCTTLGLKDFDRKRGTRIITAHLKNQTLPDNPILILSPPDQLLSASYRAQHQSLEMEFMDGFVATMPVKKLGMPVARIRWTSAKLDGDGTVLSFKGIKGDAVPVDGATLRYLVDPHYAAEMDAKLTSLQFTDEELEQLDLDEPPAGFLEQPDHDLTRESWK